MLKRKNFLSREKFQNYHKRDKRDKKHQPTVQTTNVNSKGQGLSENAECDGECDRRYIAKNDIRKFVNMT